MDQLLVALDVDTAAEAALFESCGLDGVVASPQEIAIIQRHPKSGSVPVR